MKTWTDHVHFVLVEPTEPGNIGAAARALKNMGFRRLELVNPVAHLTPEAKSMACGAKDLLVKALVYSNLESALAGKSLVVGTTRRLGGKRGLILTLREAGGKILQAAQTNRIAILFGNEHSGLTNRETDCCSFLLTIPSSTSFPSLNLAQSVMLVAYELSSPANRGPAPAATWPKLVGTQDRRRLEQRIETVLRLLEYRPKGDRDLSADIRRSLGRLLGRAGLTPWELNMLLGLCRRVEARLKK
jgi:TrmH family RNA methyltransferase